MPTEALINTSLKVFDGRADMHHVILIFLSKLILTCRYLLKLSADHRRMFLKLCRECSKRIFRSGGGSGHKWWNNRRGWNRSTLSYMHPLQKGTIDINSTLLKRMHVGECAPVPPLLLFHHLHLNPPPLLQIFLLYSLHKFKNTFWRSALSLRRYRHVRMISNRDIRMIWRMSALPSDTFRVVWMRASVSMRGLLVF